MQYSRTIGNLRSRQSLMERFVIHFQGISILDVKIDVMLSYLIDTMYFVLKKCCGKTINDDETRGNSIRLTIVEFI